MSDKAPNKTSELRAEVDLRQRLTSAERELERYRSIYGDVDAASSDSASLLERLQLKERELERLRLQVKQQREVCPTYSLDLS